MGKLASRLRTGGGHFPQGVLRVRIEGFPIGATPTVSSNSASPASWDGPSNVRFSEFGEGPIFAGGLRAPRVSASARACHGESDALRPDLLDTGGDVAGC